MKRRAIFPTGTDRLDHFAVRCAIPDESGEPLAGDDPFVETWIVLLYKTANLPDCRRLRGRQVTEITLKFLVRHDLLTSAAQWNPDRATSLGVRGGHAVAAGAEIFQLFPVDGGVQTDADPISRLIPANRTFGLLTVRTFQVATVNIWRRARLTNGKYPPLQERCH